MIGWKSGATILTNHVASLMQNRHSNENRSRINKPPEDDTHIKRTGCWVKNRFWYLLESSALKVPQWKLSLCLFGYKRLLDPRLLQTALGVTWPEVDVTFEVFDSRFELQEVGFHVSHLPQALLPWILFYATYKCWNLFYKMVITFSQIGNYLAFCRYLWRVWQRLEWNVFYDRCFFL